MRLGKALFPILGIAAIISMAVYGLYRLSTIISSVIQSGGPADIVVIFIFIFAELFILTNGVFYFINVLTSRYGYERVLSPAKLRSYPDVVVFLPMKGEPISVIEKTFRAVRYMEYPKMKVVVVDSSDSKSHQENVKELATHFGFTYFRTPYPRHGAKAGALNEAMIEFRAPYYALFDADYRPTRLFLKRVVPILHANKHAAFIQTPQFYGNHSQYPVSRIAQIQQSIFYEYVSEGKSVHNAMFMCGTNLVVRREALEEVGFWDETSITEDYATSARLMIAGWDSLYDNYTTAFGDGPLNLEQFFKQQYRWSRGTFESFFSHFLDLWSPKAKASIWQRIEYSLSGIYFLVGLIWLILLMMPVMFLLFNLQPYKSDVLMFTIVYVPYFILSFAFFLSTLRSRKYALRDLFLAQSLTFLTIPVYLKAFFDTLLQKEARFEVVEKTGNPWALPWRKMKVQWFLIFISAFAVAFGAWQLPNSEQAGSILINMFWAFFHLSIMLYLIIYLYGGSSSIRNRKSRGAFHR